MWDDNNTWNALYRNYRTSLEVLTLHIWLYFNNFFLFQLRELFVLISPLKQFKKSLNLDAQVIINPDSGCGGRVMEMDNNAEVQLVSFKLSHIHGHYQNVRPKLCFLLLRFTRTKLKFIARKINLNCLCMKLCQNQVHVVIGLIKNCLIFYLLLCKIMVSWVHIDIPTVWQQGDNLHVNLQSLVYDWYSSSFLNWLLSSRAWLILQCQDGHVYPSPWFE